MIVSIHRVEKWETRKAELKILHRWVNDLLGSSFRVKLGISSIPKYLQVFNQLILFRMMVGVIRMGASSDRGDVFLLFLQALEFWGRLLDWA